MVKRLPSGPGVTPVRAALLALLLTALPAAAMAQQGPAAATAIPVPDPIELSKLVWSTMAAIDHANRSGNYSVLRDLGAPGFQQNNDAAKLAQVFAAIRSQNIDLSNTLLLAPTFVAPPSMVAPGVLRLQGGFGLRPVAIGFDLYYQWSGRWKLYGVAINPVALAAVQPMPSPRRK